MDTKIKNGVELIAAERRRQIEVEGWTAAHDEEHEDGELAIAAACYALQPEQVASVNGIAGPNQIRWPWEMEWYKRDDDRIRELVKSGALIAAEIDRLLNAASPAPATAPREGQ
jgi:hypothetical protein